MPDATILLDETEFMVNGYSGTLKKHRIVEIYNKNGQEHGWVVVVENEFIREKRVTCEIFDAAGNRVRKLKRKDMQLSDVIDETMLYDGTRVRYLTHQWTSYPYRVEYTFEMDVKSLAFWPHWHARQKAPVKKSIYRLNIQRGESYRTHAIGLDITPVTTVSGQRRTLVWETENLKPFPDESWMAPDVYSQGMMMFAPHDFKLAGHYVDLSSWEGLARWHRKMVKGHYELSPELIRLIQRETAGCQNPEQIVGATYRLLQDKTRYVGIENGIMGWQPDDAQSTWENRYGDCKDLATLLIAMLKVNDIPAYPAKLRTRNLGPIHRDMPCLQFNHVIVMIPLESDTLWVDATADYTAPGDLPSPDRDCEALVVFDDHSEFLKTPQRVNQSTVWIQGEVNSAGACDFTGRMTFTGSEAFSHRQMLHALPEKERMAWLKKRSFCLYIPEMTIHSLTAAHLDETFHRPLKYKIQGTIPQLARSSSRRLFLAPALFHRVEDRHIPDEDPRQTPVESWGPVCQCDTVTLTFPDGYQLEAAPDSVRIREAFGSFSMSYQWDGDEFQYIRTLTLCQEKIPLDAYSAWVAFLNRIRKTDNAQWVFKRGE